jgi:TPR repeat protein
VRQDYAAAMAWLRKAADQRDSKAQCAIGYMYEYGSGVEKDDQEAFRWMSLSVAQSDDKCKRLLSELENRMTSDELNRAKSATKIASGAAAKN